MCSCVCTCACSITNGSTQSSLLSSFSKQCHVAAIYIAINIALLLLYKLRMCVPACLYVCAPHACTAHRGKKKALDCPETGVIDICEFPDPSAEN